MCLWSLSLYSCGNLQHYIPGTALVTRICPKVSKQGYGADSCDLERSLREVTYTDEECPHGSCGDDDQSKAEDYEESESEGEGETDDEYQDEPEQDAEVVFPTEYYERPHWGGYEYSGYVEWKPKQMKHIPGYEEEYKKGHGKPGADEDHATGSEDMETSGGDSE
ncbi:hypothetical protein OQA88_11517 [Cercophora sp. LCS_1]